MLNMLVTKNLDTNIFYRIYPWSEALASISWAIRDSYHCTIMATPVHAFFVRDMIFNLTSAVDWRVVTSVSQRQVDINNVRENSRRVLHIYLIGNQVYVEMTDIYSRLDCNRQGPYRITELF